jgi:hypothetical protein
MFIYCQSVLLHKRHTPTDRGVAIAPQLQARITGVLNATPPPEGGTTNALSSGRGLISSHLGFGGLYSRGRHGIFWNFSGSYHMK